MVNYKIGDALKKGIALLNRNSIENPGLDARILLCEVLGCDTVYLTVHREDELKTEEAKKYFSYIERRKNNEPVGYIVGKKEFMSLDFYVKPGILIPRPDTEILVERVIDIFKDAKNPFIIDMCTGSGAIAVSLAKYLKGSKITALDISEDALSVAKKNAMDNDVEVSFMLHDVFYPLEGIMADGVVSNPPYIPSEDIHSLESNVTEYEPHLALDGGDDGLNFYRAIVENIPLCLKKDGLLAFEVGMGQADDVAGIMEPLFYNIAVDKDLAGIKRVVYGFLK